VRCHQNLLNVSLILKLQEVRAMAMYSYGRRRNDVHRHPYTLPTLSDPDKSSLEMENAGWEYRYDQDCDHDPREVNYEFRWKLWRVVGTIAEGLGI